MNEGKQKISFSYAAFVVIFIFGFVGTGVFIFEAPLELMFLLAWLPTIPLLMKAGYSYQNLQNMAWEMAEQSFEPNVILLAIGVMIATWIAGGTIPYIIYLGLKFISPSHFLISALILASLTSLATGTSWGTLGTVGLALVGIGNAMGVPVPMTAGAIICGAYFGDKMSPLSDSTILAASIAGTPVMTHVKYMMITTGPAYIITAILFTFLGIKNVDVVYDSTIINEIMTKFNDIFNFTGIELIPPIIVLILLIKNIPSIMSLMIGAVAGMVIATVGKGVSIKNILVYMIEGYKINTGNEFIDILLNRGGTNSMISAFLAIFLALCISGMLDKTGILKVLVNPLVKKCEGSRFKIILCTIVLVYITNAIGSSMLFASIVTGTLMKSIFDKNNLSPENMSRTLEDAGTLGAVLIPWNSNAIYASQMLGVTPLAFIPYCFLNWITPIFSLIFAKTGFLIRYKNKIN